MESPRAHGFTLIEIIVSVTLLLVLSGLFMASYNGFNDSQTVKQAASTLVLNLQAVRTKAASGVKPAGCGLTDPLVGYVVNFWNLPAPSGYSAQALCQSGPVGEKSTYTLPTGVTFSSVPASVTFYALNRGASANLAIILTGFGTAVEVDVYTSGIVSNVGTTSAPTPLPTPILTSTPTPTSVPTPTPTTTQCIANGNTCNNSSECCSGLCDFVGNGYECQPTTTTPIPTDTPIPTPTPMPTNTPIPRPTPTPGSSCSIPCGLNCCDTWLCGIAGTAPCCAGGLCSCCSAF